jgi:tetratricopeptide (TPR) repeat protein
MTVLEAARHPLGDDELLALASGELTPAQAEVAQGHVRSCGDCRARLDAARVLVAEVTALRAVPVSDAVRQQGWIALAPAARQAALRARRRQAWAVLLDPPARRLLLAASLAFLALGASVGAHLAISPPAARRPAVARTVMAADQALPRLDALPRTDLAARPGPALAPSPDRSPDRVTPRAPAPRDPGLRPEPGEQLLRCGAAVALASAQATVLRDEAHRAVVRLEAGTVRLRVPRLPAGGGLEVVTPDARVQVKGTRFTVERLPAGETRVAVTEGLVWVTPTGRNRARLVLGAGQQEVVPGEDLYLRQLEARLSAALAAGQLAEAARLAQQCLDVATSPARVGDVKLRLAAIRTRLGDLAEAARLYREVGEGPGHPVTRQNALAFLARLQQRQGRGAESEATWRTLLSRHPGGLHARDALMELVQAGCKRPTAQAEADRRQLAGAHPDAPDVTRLLARCRP